LARGDPSWGAGRSAGGAWVILGGATVRHERGFTLIELLIVVVIIGILASIAIPKFANTKEKTYVGALKADLRNLATAQEAFFYDSTKYTSSLAQLNFTPTTGISMTITVSAGGWNAIAAHTQTPRRCYLYGGSGPPIPPATVEGRIVCQ
jgi:prepilin-type N-terminal cleavage/methylation domain-containing protein